MKDKAKTLDAPVPVKEVKTDVAEKSKIEGDFWADVISDYDGKIDVLLLNNKDPEYEYRYLNKNEQNLAIKTSNLLFDRGGWRLCPREHLTDKKIVRPNQVGPDGFYHNGADLILAYMPKELYKKKMDFKNKQNRAPMDDVTRLIKDGDKSNKELFGLGHESQIGLQTQKQLKIKD